MKKECGKSMTSKGDGNNVFSLFIVDGITINNLKLQKGLVILDIQGKLLQIKTVKSWNKALVIYVVEII